jgi:hypothetical protein
MILGLLLKLLVLSNASLSPHYLYVAAQSADVPSEVLAVPFAETSAGDWDNAVWLDHRWLQGGASEPELQALARRLRDARIRFVYPHLAPSDREGRLPPFSEEGARLFRKVIAREAPGVKILPWVGGVRAGCPQTRQGTVFLDADRYLQTFASECVYLTDQLGFDGVHLNIEPLEAGNSRFLEWLAYLRTRIGPEKILSVAASRPAILDEFNVSPARSWDTGYFVAVARRVDQMAVMNYDTGLPYPSWYSFLTREELMRLLTGLAEAHVQCKVLFGVPTYDDAPAHRQKAENIGSAVLGIRSALASTGLPSGNFAGIALYSYWTTSDSEWNEFDREWLNKQVRARTK